MYYLDILSFAFGEAKGPYRRAAPWIYPPAKRLLLIYIIHFCHKNPTLFSIEKCHKNPTLFHIQKCHNSPFKQNCHNSPMSQQPLWFSVQKIFFFFIYRNKSARADYYHYSGYDSPFGFLYKKFFSFSYIETRARVLTTTTIVVTTVVLCTI
jgi:hypothetical protein